LKSITHFKFIEVLNLSVTTIRIYITFLCDFITISFIFRQKLKNLVNTKPGFPIGYKSWAMILLFWLLLGFYFVLSSYVYYINLQRPFDWELHLTRNMPSFFLWGLLAPLIIYLALRYRIEKPNFYSKFLIQVLIGAVIAFIHRILAVSITYSISYFTGSGEGSLFDLFLGQKFIIFSAWFDGFFTYWVFLAAIYSFVYYKSFNENKIKATMLEAKLAQAELDALKMQLQPHFLFNTLNAISVLVHKDPESADEMITRLSDLLRHTLDKFGQKKVTLKDEIDFIESYLDIQKIRYKDRLIVEMDIAPDTIDFEVPALILQPVIENSIKYGVEPTSQQILISIKSYFNERNLTIEINDNGKGLDKNMSEGTGIKNIKSRLEQMYGGSDLFSINDLPEGGVQTKIRIPNE